MAENYKYLIGQSWPVQIVGRAALNIVMIVLYYVALLSQLCVP